MRKRGWKEERRIRSKKGEKIETEAGFLAINPTLSPSYGEGTSLHTAYRKSQIMSVTRRGKSNKKEEESRMG